MNTVSISYDFINKRLVAMIGDEKISIPVTITGTWHASISSAEITAKTQGRIPVELFAKALKKYRSNNRRGLIVTVE